MSRVNRVTKALENLAKASASVKKEFGDGVDVLQVLEKHHDAAAAAAKRQANAERDAAKAAKEAADAHRDFEERLANFIAMVGGLKVGEFIKDVTLLAARIDNLDTVMRNEGAIAHYTAGELSFYEDKIRSLGITTQVTREIMARFAQNHLDVADAAKIARIAQDAAVVAGINSSEATERLTIAIQRLDTRMLRNLGILVNLRQEYQEYGLETGRVETSLTAHEKQQIVLNAVMEAGVRMSGNYVKSLEDVCKQFTSLDRKIEEAERTICENFIPAMEVGVEVASQFYDSLARQPPAVQAMISAGLSAAATFGGMTGAIGFLLPLLNAFIASNKLAAKSVTGLLLAMAKHPIVLMGTALAALVAVISSLVWQARNAREEQLKALRSEVAREQSIRRVVSEMNELASKESLISAEQQILNDKMRDAIELMPEQERGLFRLAMSTEEFFKALLRVNTLDLRTPLEQQIQETQRLVDEQRKIYETAQAEASKVATDPETSPWIYRALVDTGIVAFPQGGTAEREL
ncbi:MAG: hypothetical protein ACK5Q5_14580 [Planctomycetaceae bacterium]